MEDDELLPPDLDYAGYHHVLAARFSRRPTPGEVAIFRHDVCAARWKRLARRRAARVIATRPTTRPKNLPRRAEPDPIREFLSSTEWMCAVSLMLSLVICITELASLWLSGRRLPMPPMPALAAVAEAVAVSRDEGDPARLGLPPRPLGSYTPDALMLAFRDIEAHRSARRIEMHGDPLYSRALASLLRSAGAPNGLIDGREAWEIVGAVDSAVYVHLRTLGTDEDLWKPLRMQVRAAKTEALKAARRVANPQPGDTEARPGYLDHLMQLGTPGGAAAYCSRKFWRVLGEARVDDDELDGIDLEVAPVPSNEKDPPSRD